METALPEEVAQACRDVLDAGLCQEIATLPTGPEAYRHAVSLLIDPDLGPFCHPDRPAREDAEEAIAYLLSHGIPPIEE